MSRQLSFWPLAFSAVLYALAFPNFNLSLLAWVALVPLALTILVPTIHSRQAFFSGWLSGTLAYTAILYWLIPTFQAAQLSMGLAGLCLVLLSAYLGLYWGLWSWILHRATGHSSFVSPFIGAAAWVTLEYARTLLFSGFPWALLADSQIQHLSLIQIASWTGSYGVSFLIVLINITLALLIHQRRYMIVFVPVGILLACLIWGNGLLRAWQENPATQKPLNVALLQGNIDQYKKWDKTYVEEIQKAYESLVLEAAQSKPDLIVWPETSVPGYLLQDKPLQAWLKKTVKMSRTNHLIGSPSEESKGVYNSSFSIDYEFNILGQYAKKHLVPFGEIVPWQGLLGRFIGVMNELGGFTAGTYSPVLPAAGVLLGVNICYEAIFPDLVRKSVREGAQVIANLTNDGWYMRTAAPYQHWAPNIFRAVENRRYVLRANNTGISGIISPTGRVIAASAIFSPCVISGEVFPMNELTFFTRFGNVFALLCMALCFMFFLLRVILRP